MNKALRNYIEGYGKSCHNDGRVGLSESAATTLTLDLVVVLLDKIQAANTALSVDLSFAAGLKSGLRVLEVSTEQDPVNGAANARKLLAEFIKETEEKCTNPENYG